MKWEIQGKVKKHKNPQHQSVRGRQITNDEIVDVLLKNRGIKTKKQRQEFIKPLKPKDISLSDVGLKASDVKKAIKRIKLAKEVNEEVIVFGDYDTDGVCATAILWETLHALGLKVLPFIPSRFADGYGLSAESIKKLKTQNSKLSLIITVDNGIVATDAVDYANKQGIDVIITDHHEPGKKLPKAHAIIHTQKIGGAGVAWFFAREIRKNFQFSISNFQFGDGLELAAIGTVADILPLVGANRSIVKYGINVLKKTTRPGLLSMFEEAVLVKEDIETYQIGWIISPRINAMGRLEHAIDSLRILCTTDKQRAKELSNHLSQTNKTRQDVVEKIVRHAEKSAKEKKWEGAIVISHESYHEGIIGLAASRLVNKFYRPAIVISKGENISKASARSISGFNIIEAVRKLDDLVDGGGHPMAAGFSVATKKINEFQERFSVISSKLLTEEILERSLKIDLEIEFENLKKLLVSALNKFEPSGVGNPAPVFCTKEVRLVDYKTVGKEAKHLKLKFEKSGRSFDAIAFGMGYLARSLEKGKDVDVAYNLEENEWNGTKTLQLKVKDIKI